MKNAKTLSSFPSTMLQALEQVGATGTAVEVSLPTRAKALRLRFEFYELKAFLRRDSSPRAQGLLPFAESVELLVREQPDHSALLIIRLRDSRDEIKALQRGLEQSLSAGRRAAPVSEGELMEEIDRLQSEDWPAEEPAVPPEDEMESLITRFHQGAPK